MSRQKAAQKREMLSGAAPKASTLWCVGVYIRLSREDGNEESESVINQKKILTEYLDSSFEGDFTVFDFYVDDGLTGTDDTRAEFTRMILAIEEGKINCIVCKTLSRAFRNYSDQGYYLEYYFPQKNVRFISTGDPKIDTFTNPEAITGLEVPITGLMNDRFAAKTSSDVRRTFNTKRRNGEFIGAFAPYGFLKDPNDKNHLILDPEIVPIKRDILRWFVTEGMSLRGIAQRLNELGVPNPTAYKRSQGWNYNNPQLDKNDGLWVGQTVRRILSDQMNLGHMVQGRQRVVSYKVHDRVKVPQEEWIVKENMHESTYSQEEYDTIMRLLQHDTRTSNTARTVYLFSGFLRCADCDKALQRKSSKNMVYYACRTYGEKSKTRCTKHSIREDVLQNAVLAAIQYQITQLESLANIIEKINQSPVIVTQNKRVDKALSEKQRELAKLQKLKNGLYLDWRSGELLDSDYRSVKAELETKIAQLEEAIANLEQEQQRAAQIITGESDVFTGFLKHKNITQLDRPLLIELVDTIFVHEQNEITIQFRFAQELERAREFVAQNSEICEE